MSWTNVRLIWFRELRDQLRDRRTLFTIVVLPLLLYPLLGMTFLQVAQFMQEHPSRVLVMGRETLSSEPPLFVEDHFASDICNEDDRRLLKLSFEPFPEGASDTRVTAEKRLAANDVEAVLVIPPGLTQSLQTLATATGEEAKTAEAGQPQVFVSNIASDRSRIASERVNSVLRRWREAIVRANLVQKELPLTLTKPFEVSAPVDIANEGDRRAVVWSKILPFVLFVWALTGAFYPAVDLCAGEKERGTLETLLSSSALRSEIVWGKLLTIMSFSFMTSVLNLLSMASTGAFVMQQFAGSMGNAQGMGPPPMASMLWLLIALPPMSALFSALSLAVAAFARSSKEGQYYLMPLLMTLMPLMMLPLLPSIQLDLGTSLIPVSGLMLLLRGLMEGRLVEVWPYFLPVAGVTAVCCLFAARWAIDQFNRESVLFRESERGGVATWFRHMLRERGDTPTFGQAMLAGVLLLVIRFLSMQLLPLPSGWQGVVTSTLIIQIAFVATPVLIMSIMLTRSVKKTLSLERPSFWLTAPAAMVLAACLHPALTWFGVGIWHLYPISERMAEKLAAFNHLVTDAPIWQVILLIGVTPAICEELAFRGFILSGFRRIGHSWTAIALASLFFGVIHAILQQSISATVVGMVIGYIAIKTGSLLPAVLYHFTHNTLTLLMSRIDAATVESHPALQLVFRRFEDRGQVAWMYDPMFAAIAFTLATAIALWYKSLPYRRTREEDLQQALSEQDFGSAFSAKPT